MAGLPIGLLRDLKDGTLAHFHLTRTVWSGDASIADVEVSLRGEDEVNDLSVG